MNSFESKKIRYASADTPDRIYRQIRERADKYFSETGLPKHATVFMAYKMVILLAFMSIGYRGLIHVSSFEGALMAYFVFAKNPAIH